MQPETIDVVTKAFYMYINSIVCIIGILCNTFNLTVLSSPRLKESPFTYLTTLACSDLLTLLFTLSTSFTRGFLPLSISLNYELFFKRVERLFFIPTANVFSGFSIAVIVALTLERFLFTKFPLTAATYCTKYNARRVIVILFSLILFFRMPMYFFSDAYIETTLNKTTNFTLTTQKIVIVKKFTKYHETYFLISLTLFEIIPFILLATLNLSIIILLKKNNNQFKILRGSLFHENANLNKRVLINQELKRDGSLLSNSRGNKLNFSNSSAKTLRRKINEIKLTRQLVALVTLVLMSEICSIVTYERITAYIVGNCIAGYMSGPYKLQVAISNNVVLVVHSVNFFILCAFNAKYLKIFKEKYCCAFK